MLKKGLINLTGNLTTLFVHSGVGNVRARYETGARGIWTGQSTETGNISLFSNIFQATKSKSGLLGIMY